MGTDIHLFVEKREADGKWVSADEWSEELGYSRARHFYSDRSYDTFAILADVRNGYGFAGVPTGRGFKPISEPKGWPSDLSEELKRESEGIEHTPSHLTLKELLEYDWTQQTIKVGMINGPQFYQWSRWQQSAGEGPDSWCGSIDGGGIVHVEQAEMKRQVEMLKAKFKNRAELSEAIDKQLGNVYTRVSWSVTYAQAAQGFIIGCLMRLLRLGKPEDVRIVFYFDS